MNKDNFMGNCVAGSNDVSDLARLLECTEQDIICATEAVGNNNLKIQQFVKEKKVKDNGVDLKVFSY